MAKRCFGVVCICRLLREARGDDTCTASPATAPAACVAGSSPAPPAILAITFTASATSSCKRIITSNPQLSPPFMAARRGPAAIIMPQPWTVWKLLPAAQRTSNAAPVNDE